MRHGPNDAGGEKPLFSGAEKDYYQTNMETP